MSKAADTQTKCPITGKDLVYAGRGRPPMFHRSASAKARREYRLQHGV